MRTVYAVFDSNDNIVEPLYDSEQDAKNFVEDTAKREFASMKANHYRYGVEGEMVSEWHEGSGFKRYDATDEGHVMVTGRWTKILLEWVVNPLKLQERSND